ncbi:hypothetical protein N836_26130 [Leptolyngbya sp. Heron Island J]|uniref:hypothetical protein n=1 Tax=Leptolyngbya sp. Heron Island J TaxID=1385935 RepID=UPI0003B992BF|nr:hypothetical protein [Leptolyngbya sp. Heron Island J]ESA32487.1 hypothetical protein N836_26130 [Leptolyngbya sp. Heron Island J]
MLAANRTIRPLLPKLILAQADQIDRQLAQLLNQTDLDETAQADRLLDVFDAYHATKSWLDQFLEIPITERGYYGLPGNLAPTAAACYIYPIGNDYTWYREAKKKFLFALPTLIPWFTSQRRIVS